MKNLNDFKKEVVSLFCETLTDKVFLMIQNDRELLHEYLLIVSNSKLAHVNSEIAKEVKKRFGLDNKDEKNREPESFLIQGHEMFETNET